MVKSSSPFTDSPRTRVVRNIKQWISDGMLEASDPLPPIRELALRLQVDKGTVRRALQILEEEGVVYARGKRLCIKGEKEQLFDNLLQNAVVIVAHYTQPLAGHRTGGWAEFVNIGALGAVQEEGLHAVALRPDLITREVAQQLASGQIKGAVITDTFRNIESSWEAAQMLKEEGLHVVVCGEPEDGMQFDHVISDHEAGAYQLTRWLLGQGHKRIANVWTTPIDQPWQRNRYKGYARAMTEVGLEPLPEIEIEPIPETEGDSEAFHRTARRTVGFLIEHLSGEQPIEAILTTTDRDVYGIGEACRLLGKHPQRDVFLVGYDNYWRECVELSYGGVPPIATVDKRNVEIGTAAVHLLRERIDGKLPEEPVCRAIAPQIEIVEASQR